MHKLESIAEKIRKDFDRRTASRDEALAAGAPADPRLLAGHPRRAPGRRRRPCRSSWRRPAALPRLCRRGLKEHPDLFYAGYTQDALKEFVEANVTCALIKNQPLPTPEELGVTGFTYLNGLAEVVGELRRKALDILRHGYSQEAERLLRHHGRHLLRAGHHGLSRTPSPTACAARPTWRAASSRRRAAT